MKNLLQGSSAFINTTKHLTPEQKQFVLQQMQPLEIHYQDTLQQIMRAPAAFLTKDSLIHHPKFPYMALKALQQEQISAHQFGTLIKLWGRVNELQSNHVRLSFVPLFLSNQLPNPTAQQYLLECFQFIQPGFIQLNPKEQLKKLYEKAGSLSLFEQGFWLEQGSPTSPQKPPTQTITQRIKSLRLHPFSLCEEENEEELIVSLGLFQTWLDIALPFPVRLNPVLGVSTVQDIRAGSLQRYRDIGMPFPGIPLPNSADGYSAPGVLDFIFHDEYHSVRASRLSIQDTQTFIKIADRLDIMQRYLHHEIKQLEQRHQTTNHFIIKCLRTTTLAATAKKSLVAKFHQENAVIATLKKIRLELGKFKFALYDMEPVFSGGPWDFSNTPHWNEINGACFILANLQEKMNLSHYFLMDCTARLIAHAIQDVFPIQQSIITTYRNEIRKKYFIACTLNQLAFERGLSEGPAVLSPTVWQKIHSKPKIETILQTSPSPKNTTYQKLSPPKKEHSIKTYPIGLGLLLLLLAWYCTRKCSNPMTTQKTRAAILPVLPPFFLIIPHQESNSSKFNSNKMGLFYHCPQQAKRQALKSPLINNSDELQPSTCPL